jgi:5-methyltetrahydrofolate--homocysteine methyltransferase
LSNRVRLPPEGIDRLALIPAMDVVGEKFNLDEIYVPEMMVSALATMACLERLKPLLVGDGSKNRETIAIGSVKGDYTISLGILSR